VSAAHRFGTTFLLALTLLFGAGPEVLAADKDPLNTARTAYNAGNYDAALQAATEALKLPGAATKAVAALLVGRSRLERFRLGSDPADLSAARDALRSIDPAALPQRDRSELVIGYAVTLFFDEAFGAAAEIFRDVLDRPEEAGTTSRERVLDWWATSVDREAQLRDMASRPPLYSEVVRRMEDELRRPAPSVAAVYWLAAAARGAGDIDRAWNAAMAGWVRAPYVGAQGETLRNDLDRLVTQAIIPERARRLPPPQRAAAIEAMMADWEQMKGRWTAPPANVSSPSP
jgi:hypothetical protein